MSSAPEEAAEAPAARMWGIGYEDPGEKDVFADGTPCEGAPVTLSTLALPPAHEYVDASALATSDDVTRKRRNPNPPAGDLHRLEAAGLWRQEAAQRIAEEEAKARGELQEKRVWGLAKQTAKGLQESLSIRYDASAIANLVRTAYRHRAMTADELDAEIAHYGSPELRDEKRHEAQKAAALLDAALQYDLPRVARALGARVRPLAATLTTEV